MAASEEQVPENAPLARLCSLCNGGYNPTMKIEIGDEPTERDGEEVYGWAHRQCLRDHDRAFMEAFVGDEGMEPFEWEGDADGGE